MHIISRLLDLEVMATRFDEESHGSMLAPAIAEALDFLQDQR